MTSLTTDEVTALGNAVRLGYLLASGQRLQVWRAYRADCRRRGVPFVAVIVGKRQGVVTVGGREIKVPSIEAEATASRLATAARQEQGEPTLWGATQ